VAEPWRTKTQDACTEPCCTGGNFGGPADTPVTVAAGTTIAEEASRNVAAAVSAAETGLRECGVTGCGYCDPVRQWIEDTDPDPAPLQPGGGDRLHYGTKGTR